MWYSPSSSGDVPIVGYRKMWLRIAALGDLPADITPHVLRHSFAKSRGRSWLQ
jgi:integrase